MTGMSPYVKSQQMIDDAEKLRQFMTDAQGCGLETLSTTPAVEIAAEMAEKYPDLFTLDAGIEGLGSLLKAMDKDIATPMTGAELQHAQMLDLEVESRERAQTIRTHVQLMREGNEALDDHPGHLELVADLNELYPDRLKDNSLASLEHLAGGLEGMAEIIAKTNAENDKLGVVDWGAVFEFANTVASTLQWSAHSPKGLAKSRQLTRAAITLLQYADMERLEADRKTLNIPGVIKARGAVMDRNIMLGQCMRGIVGVMSFQDSIDGRMKVMVVEELYLLPEYRTAENLQSMREFVRTVARANGYVGARIVIPGGVDYLETTFSGDDYVRSSTTVTTKAY